MREIVWVRPLFIFLASGQNLPMRPKSALDSATGFRQLKGGFRDTDQVGRGKALSNLARNLPSPLNGIARLAERKPAHDREEIIQTLVNPGWRDFRSASTHLATQQFSWFGPTEPQAVFGLFVQLTSGPTHVRRARVSAFVSCLASAAEIVPAEGRGPAKILCNRIPALIAEEVIAHRRRLDLTIRGRDTNQSFMIAVEAKFGHVLTDGQLEAYSQAIREENAMRAFGVVIAPVLTTSIASAIEKASLETEPGPPVTWRFISWRHLLLKFSASLDPKFDDDEFRRYRRTIHDLAEGFSK